MRSILSTFMALLFPLTASASWHVDLVNDEIVIIGSAETASGHSSFVSIRCAGDRITITGQTDQSAPSDDFLPEFGEMHALLEYGSFDGRKYLPMKATISRSIGHVIMVTVAPDPETSREIVRSIMKGNRLGFAAVHPDMDPDYNVLRVYSGGFNAVAIAFGSACPDLFN